MTNIEEQIKILCVKLGISVSELARLLGKSPQAFSQQIKRGTITHSDLQHIAGVTGCIYESTFTLPNGDKFIF